MRSVTAISRLTLRLSFLGLWMTCISLRKVDSFSSIPANSYFFPSPVEAEQSATRGAAKNVSIRIRSTTEVDVHRGISEIWARAIADPQQELSTSGKFNFKLKMSILKLQSGVEALVLTRLKAMRMWERTMKECHRHYDQDELTEADRLRYVWANDGFRNTLQKAAIISNEPHPWSRHNFACAPEDIRYMRHKMLTAENPKSGEIIGFCEIAMLIGPPDNDAADDCHPTARPTIINLVVSPNCRRQGVASRMIKSAKSFVHREWQEKDLNLYVNHENTAAISLYERLGFVKSFQEQQPSPKALQWYMTLPLLSLRSHREQQPVYEMWRWS